VTEEEYVGVADGVGVGDGVTQLVALREGGGVFEMLGLPDMATDGVEEELQVPLEEGEGEGEPDGLRDQEPEALVLVVGSMEGVPV
jgi:hypothetical protein